MAKQTITKHDRKTFIRTYHCKKCSKPFKGIAGGCCYSCIMDKKNEGRIDNGIALKEALG